MRTPPANVSSRAWPLDGAASLSPPGKKRRGSAGEKRVAVFACVLLRAASLSPPRCRDACSFLFGVWAKAARARCAFSPERPTDGRPKSIRLRGCDRFACLTQISELPPSGRGLDADHWPARVVTGALLRQDGPRAGQRPAFDGVGGLVVKGYLPRRSELLPCRVHAQRWGQLNYARWRDLRPVGVLLIGSRCKLY